MMFLISVCLLLLWGTTSSYPCSENGKCNDVSAHQKFVYCNNATNQCVCRTNQGFIGNATPESPCDCPSYLNLFQENGLSYCTNVTNGVAYQLEKAMNDHIIETEMGIYTNLIHPKPQITLYNLITNQPDPYLDYFTDDTVGRVSPVGVFAGKALVVEYYGGATYTGFTRIINVTFNSVTAYNYTGSVNVDLDFNTMNNDQTAVVNGYPLTQSGFDRYNKALKIYSADKIIHNLGPAVRSVGTLDFTNPALHAQICAILLTLSQCDATKDPLGHYANISDCVIFMSNIKAGSFDDTLLDADTVACRYFHMVFTRVDPVTHCAHAGKLGGGKCIYSPYISYYQQRFKKRVNLEVNAMLINETLNEILLRERLQLVLAGIPANSPLVMQPLEKLHAGGLTPIGDAHHHHKKDPIAMTRQFVETMKADNYALYDSIMLPQVKSLIAAGISPDHPMIREPQERLAKRKRSRDFFILDPAAMLGESLARESFTLPPTAI